MLDTPLMEEARQLIAFYDESGRDWTMALSFTLMRSLFGKFRIAVIEEGKYIMRSKRGKRGMR